MSQLTRLPQRAWTSVDEDDAASAERHRIVSELEDGPCRQLVALEKAVSLARRKLDDDPGAARVLLDEAHLDAKRALGQLREVVRGISPTILVARGLGPALSAITARLVVPVALEVSVPDRPGACAEALAYRLSCEAIGNALRHGDPRRIEVRIDGEDELVVEVVDDGCGGADPALGAGLRELMSEVRAVAGRMAVYSPEGGPTVVRAVMPVGEPSVSASVTHMPPGVRMMARAA